MRGPLLLLSSRASLIALCGLAIPSIAAAQEGDQLQDIEVGSSRIGGPGLTEAERRRNSDDYVEEELSEETLPPKGHPKRLPGLHKIAGRYFRAQMWRDACDRYDQIIDEAGPDGLASVPEGKAQASRSFLECGEIDFRSRAYDKAEILLKKSEQWGASDYRHAGLRRQMKRETYREEMGKGNVEKALTVFRSYQADKPDEDERIWMGEQLAKLAWEAYQAKDQVRLQRAMADVESIAPMNTEYRRLKDKIEGEGAVLSRVAVISLAAIFVAFVAARLSQWRARSKIEALAGGSLPSGGKKNKFIDDD